MKNNFEIESVLQFWFGEITNELSTPEQVKLWYAGGTEFDKQVTTQFLPYLEAWQQGKLTSWRDSNRGLLALIILFDQMTRNIYRGQAKAFSFDDIALELAQSLIANRLHQSYCLIERIFLYHPFEHAESLDMQNQSVALFSELSCQYPSAAHQDAIENGVSYAKTHRAIIAEFGRFPHRNQVLKRESTQAELDYLTNGGHTFGQ